MGLVSERRNRGAVWGFWGYLCIRGGHKSDKFIDVTHSQPVGVELYGSLDLLGIEKIPHCPGHPPPCGSAGERTKATNIYAAI